MKSILPFVGILAASITAASAANIVISPLAITGTLNVNVTPSTENTGNTITAGVMTTDVLAAYNNNTGGVWTFDTSFAAASGDTFSLSYGASQTSTLVLTYIDNTGGGTAQATGNPVYASGTNFMGFSGATPFTRTFTPDQPLQSIGIFELNRFDAARLFTFSATFADNSVVTTGVGNGGSTYWNGFTATGTNYIKSFTITGSGTGLTRYDDMAFVVAVPEPSSAALLGLVGFGAILRRRR